MPARPPAPRARRRRREAQARRAGGARALRRRRRDLHRRPFLHQALRVPLAHRQAQPRSAAQRSGGDRDRELRRLRTVRRGRPRRRSVSFVLSRRYHPQSELVGSRAPWRAREDHRRLRGTPRRGARMSVPQPRPITILIAALGGEGGGVLTDWIVSAAAQLNFPVQSTSIPGVAQRTGATTYYIEILPVTAHELPARPVLALAPGVGDVDIVLASELMEAGRTIAGGFVTPDRTLVIASTARSYLVVEKMAMGDGRYDSARLIKAVETQAQSHLLLDMEALAKQSSAMINAVMLGLIAGCRRVPIPAAAFEDAIRADGKAVDANLRGFRSGLDAATNANARPAAHGVANEDRAADADALAALERAIVMPAAARRLSRPRLCATLCRPAGADPRRRRARRSRRAPGQGNRASPCCAHVVRGRDPGGAGQDRSGALAAHRRRHGGQSRRAVHGDGIPQARRRGTVLAAAASARRAGPRHGRAARPARAPALGHGGQQRVGVGLSALLAAGRAARLAAEIVPLPARAAGDRSVAAPHRRGGAARGRSRARNRAMRAADQGLWRYLEARHGELPPDRDPHHPADLGGTHPALARHRRDRERALGGARRSRRRNAHALPRRDRPARQREHRRRVAGRAMDSGRSSG